MRARTVCLIAALAAGAGAQEGRGAGLPRGEALPGVWTNGAELAALPTEGPAWESLREAATGPAGRPQVGERNDRTDVLVMAKALVHARTGEPRLREEVIAACMDAIGGEQDGDCLSLGRNLAGYVIAADLVGLPPAEDERFRRWLREALGARLEGRTLRSVHETRPNNWGTHAGGSRAAVARYLGDEEELERVAVVFKGWLGDRSSYAGFEYGDLSWQADPSAPVGINPRGAVAALGATRVSLDGVLPDDQRRAGGLRWPPPQENYVYEAMQGALLQTVILHRAGYDVWEWEDRALLRAFRWLHEEARFPARGDDTWQPHLINFFYGTAFPAPVPARPGKNVGWTDWTHGTPPGAPASRGSEPGPGTDAPPRHRRDDPRETRDSGTDGFAWSERQ
jgi:hypothetical protein